MKRSRITKPSFYAYQRIILGKAECDYCGLPQSEWFQGLAPIVEKGGKIRCRICTCAKYGLEVPEDIINRTRKNSCWECRYQDLQGNTFLGRCLWFKKNNMEVKEIPPHKVDEGCKHFVKK